MDFYVNEIGSPSRNIGDTADLLLNANITTTILDTMASMVCVTDLDYNLLYVNRSLSEFYGFDRGECLNRKCYKTLFNYNAPCPQCVYPELLPDKDSYPSHDTIYLWDEQRDMWFSSKSSIIRWTDGSQAFLTTLNDVTMKKNYEDNLQETVEAAEAASLKKTAFLANMSHEMRTPLNAIVGLTELMLDEEVESYEQKNLEKIHIAGNTLLGIVNDILDISKVESGKLSLVVDEYDLPSLLNDVISLNIHLIESKPIVFHIDINENLPMLLYGDELRVKQMLNNLLSNAFKYTKSGLVTLSVNHEFMNADALWLSFKVADTGIGIRTDDVKKLFIEYYQADSKANRRIEGTGLGLAITKSLAEAMDGSISVESEFGKGSTFSVRIRQGAVNSEKIGIETVKSLQSFSYAKDRHKKYAKIIRPDLSHATALVVDDFSTNTDVVASMLHKYMMHVDCLHSGQAAIDRIKLGTPVYDVIFMDHMMPGMDGIEAVNFIRGINTEYAKTVPVIALTANATIGNEQLFLKNGFQAYLSKPLNIGKLDSVIRRWVVQKDDMPEQPLDHRNRKHIKSSQENGIILKIPGIDEEAGLSLYGEDMDIYLSALHSYAANVPTAIDKLRGVSAETLPAYAVTVHGLKGTSASIGAERLREKALILEKLSKAGDFHGVEELNADLIRDSERLVADIKKWLDDFGPS